MGLENLEELSHDMADLIKTLEAANSKRADLQREDTAIHNECNSLREKIRERKEAIDDIVGPLLKG